MMKKNNFFSVNVMCFKQWKGNNYAIFNSLNRVLKIGTLMAAYFCLFGMKQTFAQTDTASINKKINLEEVEVSARRSPAVYSEVGRVLHVISRKEIESLPVHSVQDLLRYALNVDVRQRGPLGIQADVSIRGGSFDQVMILFNGINVTDPQTGHLSLNLPVSMQSIERVEILEGPGARVYGPGAFSGAINFVTGSKKNDNLTVNAMAGEHGLYNVAANSTINTGILKSYVAADIASSDGYIHNTDFKGHSLFYQGQLDFGHEKLDFQLGQSKKEFGANSFYPASFPNQFETNKTTFASVALTAGSIVKVSPKLYWRRHQDRYMLKKEDPSFYDNHHLTDVYGASVNASMPWFLGTTSLGGEMRGENVWSNNLGNLMANPIDVPGHDAQFDKSYHRNNASSFIEHVYTYNRFSVSAGVLMNWNSSLGFKVDFFPGIDASYWFNDNVKVFASANKALNLPTFTDLFYDGPIAEGDPELKPGEAWTYEGGLRLSRSWITGQTSMYLRKADNVIDWGKAGGEATYTPRNLSDINTFGFQVDGRLDFDALFGDILLNYFEVGYSYLDQANGDVPADYESVYLLDYLKNKVTLGLNVSVFQKLSLSVKTIYQDRQGSYESYPSMDIVDYKPFWLTDLRLQWSEKKYKVFIDANNLFDTHYYDLGNVPQPGRWMKAGVQVSLDW